MRIPTYIDSAFMSAWHTSPHDATIHPLAASYDALRGALRAIAEKHPELAAELGVEKEVAA